MIILSLFDNLYNFLDANHIKEILNVFTLVVACITAIWGVIKFSIDMLVSRKERRIRLFRGKIARANAMRDENTSRMFHFYKEKYKTELAVSSDSGLIIHKDWELPHDQELIPLDEVEINNVSNDLDSLLTNKQRLRNRRLAKKLRKNLPGKKYGYSKALIRHSEKAVNLFNGGLFAARRISKVEKDGKVIPQIDTFSTNYFNFVDTCKVLEYQYSIKHERLLPEIDIFDFTNRHAGIGVNCLTVFPNLNNNGETKDYFLIHKRGGKVMESPGAVHVVPAGSFQPIKSINLDKKCNDFNKRLVNTVYREFCEEVFMTEHISELASINLLVNHQDYKKLNNEIEGYKTLVYYLGVGLEPYNTKVEVLSIMICEFEDVKTYSDLKNLVSPNGLNSEIFYSEGEIVIEEFSKPMLEEYWSLNNVTPSAKEIFKKVYERFDEIKTKIR